MSIRFKLLVLVGGILLVSMGGVLLLAERLLRAERLSYAFASNPAVAQTVAAQVATALRRTESQLRALGESTRAEPPELREALVRRFLDAEPGLIRLTVLVSEGQARPAAQAVAPERAARVGLTQEDLHQLDRSAPVPFERAAAEGLVIVNRSRPPASRLLTVVIAGQAQPAQSAWYVAADLAPEDLFDMVPFTPLSVAYLVDAQGRVITHPNPELVVSRISLAERPIVATALKGGDGDGMVSTEDGMQAAYARVDPGRLWAISEVERNALVAPSRRLIHLSLLLGMAIALAASVVIIVFARRLTERIARLRAATAKLAAGHFGAEPWAASEDELGRLARDFETMADRLRETQLDLIESERMTTLGEVGAGISHDVKNPLTGIIGFAELALMEPARPKAVDECLRHIHQAALNASAIIRDFLTYTRQASDMQAVDLNAVVAAALRMVLYQLRRGSMLVHETYGAAPPVRVRAGQIQHVIMNLAMNAQQASGKGGNLTLVTRTLADGRAEVEMSDDGPGIPGEIIARIFEPFFTTKSTGTGLGLAVSRRIIEAHGGELAVESELGAGATFRIRLPADTPDLLKARTPDP